MTNIDRYIRILKHELSVELANKKLIYLDLNFWIKLRDCFINKDVENEYSHFYNLLLNLVKNGKVLCPINHSIMFELLKQNDVDSRRNTAKVIDLFSNSTTLIFEFEREELELQYYIRQKLLKESFLPPIKKNVWVKMPFIMGTMIPYHNKLDAKTQESIQYQFIKTSWNMSFEEMISHFLDDFDIPLGNMTERAFRLNNGKFSHSNQVTSLNRLLQNELRGYLSVYIEIVQDYFKWLSANRKEILALLVNRVGISSPNDLCSKIEKDILENNIEEYLPNIAIESTIYAMMRWNKTRKYKANDFYDFEHARAALAYYDYFFTEKSLMHLLQDKPYELSKKYNCVVKNDIKSINKLLLKWQANPPLHPTANTLG